MADESTSVMPYIIENTTSNSDHDEVDTRDEQQCQSVEGKSVQEKLHQHPLIFHDINDGGDHQGQWSRTCNACIQSISPPFYSCSECPDFYLHDCCANLPSKMEHPAHKQHPLLLFPKAPKSSISGFFVCQGCQYSSNRFAYSCTTCDFTMDVVCAFMPPSITHESHGKTHILYRTHKERFSGQMCNCCKFMLLGICYECSTCHQFKIHARCALLPKTIKHKFDEHLLKLTTKPDIDDDDRAVDKVQQICEICEQDNLLRNWHYTCTQCNQSFHYDCLPSVNGLSRIKFGITIHVDCHDCPLTRIPESSVYTCRCGYCLQAISPSYMQKPAYECSNCYFRIHEECAQKCLLKS